MQPPFLQDQRFLACVCDAPSCMCACDKGRRYHVHVDLINYAACINLHLYVLYVHAWTVIGSRLSAGQPGSDLSSERRNMSEQRGEDKIEELEERRGSISHGLVSSTLPCCCTGDGFLQCSGHIITFTHFCLVSRSTEASPSWDRQQKSCRGLKQTSEKNTNNKIHQQKAARNCFILIILILYFMFNKVQALVKFTLCW